MQLGRCHFSRDHQGGTDAAHAGCVAATVKILAVDDEDAIRRAMSFIFNEPRYEMALAVNGGHALAKIEAWATDYDVVIVDQKMPQLTGLEFVQRIRKRGIRAKIIVLSAHLTAEIRQAYQEMGVALILAKPFDIEEIRSAVDRLAA